MNIMFLGLKIANMVVVSPQGIRIAIYTGLYSLFFIRSVKNGFRRGKECFCGNMAVDLVENWRLFQFR
jgi:hypothetical protein